jgi:hypothetical protein
VPRTDAEGRASAQLSCLPNRRQNLVCSSAYLACIQVVGLGLPFPSFISKKYMVALDPASELDLRSNII